MKGNGMSISKLGKTKEQLKIESYEEDIERLEKMLEIYDETGNLNGKLYSDMTAEIKEQIKFCEMCIKNLDLNN